MGYSLGPVLTKSLAPPGGAQVVTMALATVGLYVSIFNLFTSLLSLFGFGSSDE